MTLLRLASARTFSSLRRHRNYRLFFAGQLTSVAGTWMQNIAMAWLVVQLAPHSRGLAVGILTVCRFGPFTVLGLVAGVVTDRLDNRRTVIITQTVQMFFSAVLAVITLVGHVQLWEVYAIAALTGIAIVFDAPARQNLTFQMVGRDELPNAVALNSSLFNTARIFGPALAGVLIAAFGAGWCFALNTLSFLAVLAGLLAMRVRDLYPLVDRRRPTLWRGTREGFAYARNNRTVLVILAMMVVFSSVCFNFNILLPLLAKTTLDAGPRTFGIISACFGAGALIGALSAAAIAKASWRVMFIGAFGFGICELVIAPVHTTLGRRAAALRLRHLLHELHRQLERRDPAREPGLHPRPRARALLLRVERPRAARGAPRRLDVRHRRHRARVLRRRHDDARDHGARRRRPSSARGGATPRLRAEPVAEQLAA